MRDYLDVYFRLMYLIQSSYMSAGWRIHYSEIGQNYTAASPQNSSVTSHYTSKEAKLLTDTLRYDTMRYGTIRNGIFTCAQQL